MKPHFTSKSFKYLNSRLQNQASSLGHVNTRTQFNEKIDLLRVPVYEKKKKCRRNISQKHIALLETAHPSERNSHKRKKTGLDCQQQKRTPKHFRYRSMVFQENSKSKLTKTAAGFEEGRKSQNRPMIDMILAEREIHRETSCLFERNAAPNHQKQLVSRSSDSQSLLRKSSLFLINFMKRKEKQDEEGAMKVPHIAGLQNVAFNMKLSASPKKPARYQPASTRRKAPAPQRIVSSLSKILNNMPIGPW